MIDRSKGVDDYLATLAEDRRLPLTAMRDAIARSPCVDANTRAEVARFPELDLSVDDNDVADPYIDLNFLVASAVVVGVGADKTAFVF